MRVWRYLAFAGVMLIGAALVAWWCTANHVARFDSPFGSPSFEAYFLFALAGELLIGLPYALAVRVVLRRFHYWSLLTMAVSALVPGLILILLDGKPGGPGQVFGPCVLIAGIAMATGWYLLRFDGPLGTRHA